MKSDYLTQEELLYALEHEGLEVQERTLRFWIAKGVLEKPVKKPYKFADGRKKYFPTRVVGEITELLRLQEEGWKLTQIKKRLRTPIKAKQADSAEGEEMAKRLLADYLGNGEFKDRHRLIESADASTPEWRRVRNFLVARLSHFVGRKQAVRSVTSFMVGLSKRDIAKLLRRQTSRAVEDTLGLAESDAGEKWSRARAQELKKTLNALRPPEWTHHYPEPVLSRRLRRALTDTLAATESYLKKPLSKALETELESRLRQVRQLHSEVKASLEFLHQED